MNLSLCYWMFFKQGVPKDSSGNECMPWFWVLGDAFNTKILEQLKVAFFCILCDLHCLYHLTPSVTSSSCSRSSDLYCQLHFLWQILEMEVEWPFTWTRSGLGDLTFHPAADHVISAVSCAKEMTSAISRTTNDRSCHWELSKPNPNFTLLTMWSHLWHHLPAAPHVTSIVSCSTERIVEMTLLLVSW